MARGRRRKSPAKIVRRSSVTASSLPPECPAPPRTLNQTDVLRILFEEIPPVQTGATIWPTDVAALQRLAQALKTHLRVGQRSHVEYLIRMWGTMEALNPKSDQLSYVQEVVIAASGRPEERQPRRRPAHEPWTLFCQRAYLRLRLAKS